MAVLIAGRKKAQQLLKDVGNEFITSFLAGCSTAISLRSKEPSLCWKAGGIISFAALSEYSGPNSMEDDSPTTFRLRVNFNPPPALHYHINSPAVRHKLGIHVAEPAIAETPALELTAMPDEMAKFGPWLINWLESQFRLRDTPPTAPIPLVVCGWDEQGGDKYEPFDSVGKRWRDCTYVWTQNAIDAFYPWVTSER